MAPRALYESLLRPVVLHILRAAGYHSAKPAAIDTLVDLTVRYLCLLSSTTAEHALRNHNEPTPDITDVRMALQDVGAFYPQMSEMEEQVKGQEDLRGVEAFVKYFQSTAHHEILRIAGLAAGPGEIPDNEELEDYLTGIQLS